MVQSGLHGIIGIGIAFLLGKKLPSEKKYKWLQFGLIFGSVIPDIDHLATVIACIILVPFYGLSIIGPLGLMFHRTFTHSLFFIVIILLLGIIIPKVKSIDFSENFTLDSVPILAIGISLGIGLHLLIDLQGTFQFFWPLPTFVGLYFPYMDGLLFYIFKFIFLGLELLLLIFIMKRTNTNLHLTKPLFVLAGITFVTLIIGCVIVIILPITVLFIAVFDVIYISLMFISFIAIYKVRETLMVFTNSSE